jgi:hypothetical protein
MRWKVVYDPVTLRCGCGDFDSSGIRCCLSCHEDEDYNFPLIEMEHPKNSLIRAEVCCAVSNYFSELSEDEQVVEWEKALGVRKNEGVVCREGWKYKSFSSSEGVIAIKLESAEEKDKIKIAGGLVDFVAVRPDDLSAEEFQDVVFGRVYKVGQNGISSVGGINQGTT